MNKKKVQDLSGATNFSQDFWYEKGVSLVLYWSFEVNVTPQNYKLSIIANSMPKTLHTFALL